VTSYLCDPSFSTVCNLILHFPVVLLSAPMASLYALNVGNVTSAGWQATLCDPMWHVSSRSGVATLRTAIHLLLTYLLRLHVHCVELRLHVADALIAAMTL